VVFALLINHHPFCIVVMLQPFDYDPAEKYTHKFMIQTLIVEGDQDDVVGVTIVCLPQIQDKCVNCGGQSG